MRIDKLGIWFIHAKGTKYEDEVCWMWWWKRTGKDGKKWISMIFNASFKSLKEIDGTWDGYVEACKECYIE